MSRGRTHSARGAPSHAGRLRAPVELISIVQQRLARWLGNGGVRLSDGTLIGVAIYPGCHGAASSPVSELLADLLTGTPGSSECELWLGAHEPEARQHHAKGH